jgi:predicted transcriptional regulator
MESNLMLTFEQQQRSHKSRLQKKPVEKILYLFHYRLLKRLQEPKNRYEIVLAIYIKYKQLEPVLAEYKRKGIIKEAEFNPNKFILTAKGIRLFYLIKELNKLLDKYVTISDN